MANTPRTKKPLRERVESSLQKFTHEAEEADDLETRKVVSRALSEMTVIKAEAALADARANLEGADDAEG